ncbi:MAG: DDE-type integrase/transposase/recombinase, partial [Alphaproteobacteria bacterium]|nr:DDE-type integrase/transposase/recombinase [Alphaproteobacteria bacterium]
MRRREGRRDDYCGHDCEGSSRVLRAEETDQGYFARSAAGPEHGALDRAAEEETERRYERREQPLPRLGPFVAALDEMLAANTRRPKRERLTYQRMFEELRFAGYRGGYDNIRRYARVWAEREGARTAEAYVPLSFECVVIDGVTTMAKVAQVRLCHSRMLFVRAYPREAQEMVFDAHERAFQLFKGVPKRGIYDNMKTAARSGSWRPVNPVDGDHRFQSMATTHSGPWRPGQQGGGLACGTPLGI